MNSGIYISGLTQSVSKETVEKYAARLVNELEQSTTNARFELKTEKIQYANDRESTVVSISQEGEGKPFYRLYDFQYRDMLVEKFKGMRILVKNFFLLLLVVRKFPTVLKRVIVRSSYSSPIQTVYLFGIFLLIALSVIIMLPATIDVILGHDVIVKARDYIKVGNIPFLSLAGVENFSKTIVGFTTLLLLLIPNANVLITELATEFVCANEYIEHGVQKQLIQGSLDKLIDHITEVDPDTKIQLHSYSFGTIVAIDHLFPLGQDVGGNTRRFCNALITIGSPFEFVNSYYEKYYVNRRMTMNDAIVWINIYSVRDALASNFRRDGQEKEAEFGITRTSMKPINIPYEIASYKQSIISFLMLTSLKVHGSYWDTNVDGQSCLRYILTEMKNHNLIKVNAKEAWEGAIPKHNGDNGRADQKMADKQ